MTYQQIKSFINTYIVQNGVNAITGAQLNTILNELADYKGFDSVVVTTLPAGSDATATVQGMTLVLGIPKGADGRDGRDGQNAVNPFKGWFTTDNIPTTGQAGDYCNVSTTTQPATVTIYRWNTTTNQFEDTGEVPDTETGETFASGETLQAVAIDDSHLVNPVNTADDTQPVLADAKDVMQIKQMVAGSTFEETKVVLIESGAGQNVFTGYVKGKDGSIGTNTAMRYLQINVEGFDKVRFISLHSGASSPTDSALGYSFGHIENGSYVSDYSEQQESGYQNTEIAEYLVDIPKGATTFRTSCRTATITADKFYCYLIKGESIDGKAGLILTDVILKNSYLAINYTPSATGIWDAPNPDNPVKHALIPIDERVESVSVMTKNLQGNFAFLSDADNYPVYHTTANTIDGRKDLAKTACVRFVVPAGAKFIAFNKGTEGTATPYSIRLNIRHTQPLENYGYSDIELQTARMSDATGQISMSQAANYILNRYGSYLSLSYDSIGMKILSVEGIPAGGTLTYYCFSKDYVFIGSTSDKDKIPFGTSYVRFGVAFNSIPAFKHIKLRINYIYSNAIAPRVIKSFGKNKNNEKDYLFFSMEVNVPHIDANDGTTIDYYRDNPEFTQSINGRDFTQATIYLADNYEVFGKPTKTIVNFHGTTTYPFDRTLLSDNLIAIYGFLAKNGYNVIDVCTCSYNTNKLFKSGGAYASDTYRDANYPTPLSWSCYQALVNRIKKEFNIEQDGFYFLGKSAGGMNAITMAQRFGIQVKAMALIAPGIDVYTNMITVGSTSSNYFLSRIGCANPQLSSGGRARMGAKAEDEQYLEDNSELINDFNPFFIGTDGFDKDAYIDLILSERTEAPVNYPYSLINLDMLAILANAKRFFKAPIKIWHALDDNAVPIEISEWFQKMCHNANCLCELRKWPAEHGRHYLDSFGEHTGEVGIPVLTDYTTPLSGEVMQASVVYCEIVDWFNRY